MLELDGVAVEKPLSVTRPTRGGGRLQIVYEYGSATDGGAAEAAPARAATARGQLQQQRVPLQRLAALHPVGGARLHLLRQHREDAAP